MTTPQNHELEQRLAEIRARMASAAQRAGRSPDDITLIAVTKTHPVETLDSLIGLGQLDLGENRVQEMTDKIQKLGDRARWHFIGHLQRNKVVQVVGRVAFIHSVDSVRLIGEIEKRAAVMGAIQRVLLEINLGGEEAKTGALPEELPAMLDALSRAPHIRAEGLMTVPPYDENSERSRPYFVRLREIMANIPQSASFRPLHLSMGMSGDFEVAIEEGATMIRVGTALLGERS